MALQQKKLTKPKKKEVPLIETVRISIMGKNHDVPTGLTILKAMESAGYRLVRGVGCRGGFCGACATVYRKAGDFRLQVGLACQTGIEDGMFLAQIPFYPAPKPVYNIHELSASAETMFRFFPELVRCIQCNTCAKVCPQGLEVMRYIAAAQQGDLKRLAELSFDCISCGLCVSRCPAEIAHYHVGMLARRLYGSHVLPKAAHLHTRLEEIKTGYFEEELDKFCRMDKATLQRFYSQRVIESEEEDVPLRKSNGDKD
ncbi:MAG: 4Fe-4S dicluster domain-containing protein [Deltaproteobacteria bacterium]|nr:4Fe-4S dicluster domain-containing protein [Deltaproteobacteria bacterium]